MGCCHTKDSAISAPTLQHLSVPLPASSNSYFNSTKSTPQNDSSRSQSVLRFQTSKIVNVYRGRLSDFYEIGESLGEGAFGCVRLATHKKLQVKRAVKSILKSYVKMTEAQTMLAEVDFLRQLDHPNILKVQELIEDLRCYHIVTDLCTGGELLQRVLRDRCMTETTAAGYLCQIISAVNYCHRHGICHRDIKPENILFKNDSAKSPLVVIDFGVSRLKNSDKSVSCYGIPYYTAPEVLLGEFTEKSDVWSCGVVLYLMLCGRLPFNGRTEWEVTNRVKDDEVCFTGEEWDTVSEDAKSLVRLMLNKAPSARISADTVLGHPWVQAQAPGQTLDQQSCISAFEKLSKFKPHLKLTHSVLEFIAAHYSTEKEAQELQNVFIALDTNRDGVLSREELGSALEVLGLTHIALDDVLGKIDADQNGYIDYSEFITAGTNWQEFLSKERLELAFQAFDTDGDGLIDRGELKAMLGGAEHYDEDLWTQIIEEADLNCDGAIDISEFERAIIRRTTGELDPVQ